ncbi:hypothetical protein F4778DRAFT_645837 [Xylariomycetidae sp. FL2044]|nr:hypothetical protein F4778DRAFT_645837 [Xylariomycetidae sp. FL2044]
MEAVAAVSLVGTIFSLVDFAGKVISGSWRLYVAAKSVLTRYSDLEWLASNLNKKIEVLKAHQELSHGSVDDTTRELGRRTLAIVDELQEILRGMQVPGSKSRIQCLKTSLKNVRPPGKLDLLKNRVSSLSSEVQTQWMMLLSQQNQHLLVNQQNTQQEMKEMLNNIHKEVRGLVSQSSRRPEPHGYEWEPGDWLTVDDGLGPRFRFPTDLCGTIEAFVGVLNIKFRSRNLPGLRQIQLGLIDIEDAAGNEILDSQDWTSKAVPGALIQISFVMGTWHELYRSKCIRCRKPYGTIYQRGDWKECRSCGLNIRRVPPDAYAYEPADIFLGMGNIYHEYKLALRLKAKATSGNAMQDTIKGHPNPEPGGPMSSMPASQDSPPRHNLGILAMEQTSIDLVCRRMIVKWEPMFNIVHRYLLCRCVIRLSTPSRLDSNPEKTITQAAACPRHNNKGVSHRDYGDLVDNHSDPYFDQYGGYDRFRALVVLAGEESLWEQLGGDAFIGLDEALKALRTLDDKYRENKANIEQAWGEYVYEVNSHAYQMGRSLPEDIAQKVRDRVEREEREREERWGEDRTSSETRDIPMFVETEEILDGKWDGIPHWAI